MLLVFFFLAFFRVTPFYCLVTTFGIFTVYFIIRKQPYNNVYATTNFRKKTGGKRRKRKEERRFKTLVSFTVLCDNLHLRGI